MIKSKGFVFVVLSLFFCALKAQNSPLRGAQNAQDEITQGWTNEVAIGVDFLSNLLINPTVGGGTNRLGFGASFELINQYNYGRFSLSLIHI